MSIAEILLEKGLLRIDQIDEALALQRAEGLRLDRAILQLGFLSERQLLGVMSEHLHLPVVNLDEMTFDPEILRSLPPKIVYRKRMVPISRTNGTLKVATSDAFDLYALDDIRLMTGLDIQPVLAPRDDIEKAINESDLGINPGNDGKVIRLAIPQLTEERRKELVKVVRSLAEEGRVAVRNIRRDVISDLHELESEVGADEIHRAEERVQKVTDEHVGQIDALLKQREADIMEV